ncbi:hypothetical protein [Bradyrhizobium sp. I71]|uniref:hypothetical protein n=1 Tax=Bradyrhizobium sp. I71 TaxID=2590772 RepID=UPI001EF7E637|nr:hypothetical protein [Bradyrhizobium sp. I71]ULK94968.1 hypothetical protein FJV43_19325 [Bradyrhizobium sp. I71]
MALVVVVGAQLPCGDDVGAIVVDASVSARIGATAAPEQLVFPSCAHVALSRAVVLRQRVRAGDRECEAHHTHIAAAALLVRAAGGGLSRITAMSMRRMMYWWFRFVLSGRFFDRFLSLPRARRA